MAHKMFRPLEESKTNDWAGPRRDAVNDIISSVLVDSRTSLTAAVTRPGDGVSIPFA
jgi:hypothetical protein